MCLYNRQAKSQCKPSSLDINTLEKLRPGINPRFLSQKMAQKLSKGRQSDIRSNEREREMDTQYSPLSLSLPPRKVDPLNAGKGHQPLSKAALLIPDPSHGPLGFLPNAGDGVNGPQEEVALFLVPYIC